MLCFSEKRIRTALYEDKFSTEQKKNHLLILESRNAILKNQKSKIKNLYSGFTFFL